MNPVLCFHYVAVSVKLIQQFIKHVYLLGTINCVALSFVAKASPTNLALRKPTQMSSTHGRYTSDKAVDGNKNMSSLHCSHTTYQRGTRAWWQVDLQAVYIIRKVVITNRGDRSGEWTSRACWAVYPRLHEERSGTPGYFSKPPCSTVATS